MSPHRRLLASIASAALLVFLLIDAAPLGAENALQRGLAAHAAGDFEEAARLLFPLAVDGDPQAQFKIGEMYEVGEFFRHDACMALVWWDKAARGGHALAMSFLAIAYTQGEGVIYDRVRAHLWAVAAAARGELGAEATIQIMWLIMSDEEFATAQRLQIGFRPETTPPVDLYPLPQPWVEDGAMLRRLAESGMTWCRRPGYWP
ncbi:tetratricopeptide repeat protein [Algihabitans albus]|uniref:tetratricopeptide repeat protein n=1 Tax=Algihabitans albus TaxID=2164067 RepID=UPI0013C2C148|nr:tetratricopeptide repeat protein [Algihabitans albus]